MAKAVDLVLKNAAAVNKTFALINPASGSTPALWWLKEGANSALFPSIEASARPNAGKTARKAQLTLKLPSSYVQPVTGLAIPGPATLINITVTSPITFPESQKDDFVAYAASLVNDALIKQLIRDAVAAN